MGTALYAIIGTFERLLRVYIHNSSDWHLLQNAMRCLRVFNDDWNAREIGKVKCVPSIRKLGDFDILSLQLRSCNIRATRTTLNVVVGSAVKDTDRMITYVAVRNVIDEARRIECNVSCRLNTPNIPHPLKSFHTRI